MKKVYGFKLTDRIGGEFVRWFSTDGQLTVPCTPELFQIAGFIRELPDFDDALGTATRSIEHLDIEMTLMFEYESPIKTILKRLFK